MGNEIIAVLGSGQVAGFWSSSVAVVGVGSVLGLFVWLSVYVQPFLSCDAPKIIAKILAGGCRAILESKLWYARLKRKKYIDILGDIYIFLTNNPRVQR